MLKPEVVEAVRAGLFHIYPVRTIAEGIEILTGVPAGEAGPDGQYPLDSINGKVNARLQEMAEALARFGKDS
jgi:Lon-like ATP-dependent protease